MLSALFCRRKKEKKEGPERADQPRTPPPPPPPLLCGLGVGRSQTALLSTLFRNLLGPSTNWLSNVLFWGHFLPRV